jgi:hypothetical protein
MPTPPRLHLNPVDVGSDSAGLPGNATARFNGIRLVIIDARTRMALLSSIKPGKK